MGQREAAANENDGESDFVWPRPQFCGSGPSPNVRCSSRRGSQCQYLATSEIPTQLLNLVLPDSDDEDIVVDVEEKSKRNSVDKSSRRSSSILSLAAMSEEFGLELERKGRSSSIRSSILSLAMSEDFGLELENSMSKLSLGGDMPLS